MVRENVRCPKCMWHPFIGCLWGCVPSCGTSFDTFATRGRCPGCDKVWFDTQCPVCHGWSAHGDWYLKLERVEERTEVSVGRNA